MRAQSRTATEATDRVRSAGYAPSRRQVLLGGGAMLMGLAACSNESEESPGESARTIEHKYGSTQITGTPERVVTVGLTEQDPVLALGLRPVGLLDWYGDHPHGVWPWAQEALGDAEPEVLTQGEFNFEQIAALEPELITGVSSGMSEEDFERLSSIAPTVAQSGEYQDYGTPWEEQTRTIGRALGREDEAEDLITQLEADFAAVREQFPQFAGTAGVVAAAASDGGSYLAYVYSPEDVRSRFLTALGFEIPDEIAQLAGDMFSAELSREQLAALEHDAVVWVSLSEGGLGEVQDDPLYQQLDVARDGRDVFLEDEELNGALSFSTVLSLEFALETLPPLLADAVDE